LVDPEFSIYRKLQFYQDVSSFIASDSSSGTILVIQLGMCAATFQRHILIAVPSYENRVMPRFGQAREFHFAEVDALGGRVVALRLNPLPPSASSLQAITWLAQNGVQGVVCAGIHPRFQTALHCENIWVCWGYRGEVSSVIQQWLVDGMLVSRQEPFGTIQVYEVGRKKEN
jgi:predicted Fe-Mo cluster-binding NifX family protein